MSYNGQILPSEHFFVNESDPTKLEDVIYTNIVTQDKLLQGGKDYMIRIEHCFRLTICGCTR